MHLFIIFVYGMIVLLWISFFIGWQGLKNYTGEGFYHDSIFGEREVLGTMMY